MEKRDKAVLREGQGFLRFWSKGAEVSEGSVVPGDGEPGSFQRGGSMAAVGMH